MWPATQAAPTDRSQYYYVRLWPIVLKKSVSNLRLMRPAIVRPLIVSR